MSKGDPAVRIPSSGTPRYRVQGVQRGGVPHFRLAVRILASNLFAVASEEHKLTYSDASPTGE